MELAPDAQVELPALEEAIALNLWAGGSIRLSFDSLRTADTLAVIHPDRHPSGATELTLPQLTLAGSVSVDRVDGPLELPSLTQVGSLSVDGDGLTGLSAPLLTKAGSLALHGSAFDHLELPALAEAGQIFVPLAQLSCDLASLFPALRDTTAVRSEGLCP